MGCLIAATLLDRRFPTNVSVTATLAVHAIATTVALVVLCAITRSFTPPDDVRFWLATLVAAVGPTLAGYAAYWFLLRRVGVRALNGMLFLVAPSTAVAGAVLFAETLTIATWTGFLLCTAGVTLVLAWGSQRSRNPSPGRSSPRTRCPRNSGQVSNEESGCRVGMLRNGRRVQALSQENTPEDTLITAPAGVLRGQVVDSGVIRMLGVPYAEAPVGPRRFQRPVRRAPWKGSLDATGYGPTAPQSAATGPLRELLPRRIITGDDYLNLNLWAPTIGDGHPVMVFVHGGSWTSGSGAVGGYDGTRFARDGVVLVTINYRLGADGFAWFGDGPANLALLDQICALEWVHDNIAAFGGDPGNVTVFGESSGAMSIGALLAMPAARGRFRRAILESGSTFHSISSESARLVAKRMSEILHVRPTREALAEVPLDALLDAQTQLAAEVSKRPRRSLWGDVAVNGLVFEPVVDGRSLPTSPIEALRAGAAADVDLLIGWNREEANIALVLEGPDRMRNWMVPLAAARTKLPLGKGTRTYRRAFRGERAAATIGGILTDWLYRIPAIRTAEAHPRTHLYEFAWRSPAFDGRLGACHGVELPFVFDNLDHADWEELVGASPPQHLADDVHGAWVRFARTGDPGWDPYSSTQRTTHRFDTAGITLTDPDSTRRTIWEDRR